MIIADEVVTTFPSLREGSPESPYVRIGSFGGYLSVTYAAWIGESISVHVGAQDDETVILRAMRADGDIELGPALDIPWSPGPGSYGEATRANLNVISVQLDNLESTAVLMVDLAGAVKVFTVSVDPTDLAISYQEGDFAEVDRLIGMLAVDSQSGDVFIVGDYGTDIT